MKAKCPKCHKKIELLLEFRRGETKYEFTIEKTDGGMFGFSNQIDAYVDETADTDFECPQCNAVLTHDEDMAMKILNGEFNEVFKKPRKKMAAEKKATRRVAKRYGVNP